VRNKSVVCPKID